MLNSFSGTRSHSLSLSHSFSSSFSPSSSFRFLKIAVACAEVSPRSICGRLPHCHRREGTGAVTLAAGRTHERAVRAGTRGGME